MCIRDRSRARVGREEGEREERRLKWTEGRKKRHSGKMKEYWRKRKEQRVKN